MFPMLVFSMTIVTDGWIINIDIEKNNPLWFKLSLKVIKCQYTNTSMAMVRFRNRLLIIDYSSTIDYLHYWMMLLELMLLLAWCLYPFWFRNTLTRENTQNISYLSWAYGRKVLTNDERWFCPALDTSVLPNKQTNKHLNKQINKYIHK